MYIHFQSDVAIISSEVSDTQIPLPHVLKTIKASLKTGRPVLLKFKNCNVSTSSLLSKHYVANTDFAFINISLKNRFPIERELVSLTEMVDYMLDLNTQLS